MTPTPPPRHTKHNSAHRMTHWSSRRCSSWHKCVLVCECNSHTCRCAVEGGQAVAAAVPTRRVSVWRVVRALDADAARWLVRAGLMCVYTVLSVARVLLGRISLCDTHFVRCSCVGVGAGDDGTRRCARMDVLFCACHKCSPPPTPPSLSLFLSPPA
jgi:hypothetical protein